MTIFFPIVIASQTKVAPDETEVQTKTLFAPHLVKFTLRCRSDNFVVDINFFSSNTHTCTLPSQKSIDLYIRVLFNCGLVWLYSDMKLDKKKGEKNLNWQTFCLVTVRSQLTFLHTHLI